MASCTVSLRIVLVSMVLLVAIVAAAVSFAPLYEASLSAATDSGQDFSASISREIASSTRQYFDVMQNSATVMVSAAKLGGWAEEDVPGIRRWMNYGVTLGSDSINMIFDGIVMWTAGHTKYDNTDVGPGEFVLVKYNLSYGEAYVVNTTDLSTIEGPTYFASTLNFRNRQYFPVIRSRQGWGRPFIGVSLGVSEAVVPCGAPIVLPNGTSVGGFYVRTRAKIVVEYFQSLKVATTGRAMLVDPETGFFVASNNPADPLTKTFPNGTTVVTSYTDVVDPLIQSVTASLGEQLLTCSPMPCSFKVGSGADLTYVTVSSVNDSFALNKRLVIMIPSEDFLGKIRSSATTSLAAAAGAVAGLLICASIAVLLIARPLQRLEARLYASVTLEDDVDEEGGGKSVFTEILRIEEAYDKLQCELQKVKSFLPQSVLKQLEERDDEENDDDEGEIADSPTTSYARSATVDGGRTVSRRTDSVGRSTHHTMHSMTSEERRLAIERGRTLNTTSSLQLRPCTVVLVNTDGLHKHMKSPSTLTATHTSIMNIIATHVNATKGVLDAFHGDRFTLTFNSSTNCASHGAKAAQFVLLVLHDVALQTTASPAKPAATPLLLRFGVATGRALCGNLGTEKIKRFCTVGPVLNQAQMLVDRCRSFGVSNLVTAEAMKGMTFEYTCDNVTIAALPQIHDGGGGGSGAPKDGAMPPSLIGTIRERRSSKMDEWMYELQEGEASANKSTGDARLDTVITLSNALEKTIAGNATEAHLLLEGGSFDTTMSARVAHVKSIVAARMRGDPYPTLDGGPSLKPAL